MWNLQYRFEDQNRTRQGNSSVIGCFNPPAMDCPVVIVFIVMIDFEKIKLHKQLFIMLLLLS